MHFVMGAIFGVIYAAVWNAGVGSVSILRGIIFGAVHWLVVGLLMAAIPMMHTGIRAGTVEAPGIYMMNRGGMMALVGGLVGHVLIGLVVALVFAAFVG